MQDLTVTSVTDAAVAQMADIRVESECCAGRADVHDLKRRIVIKSLRERRAKQGFDLVTGHNRRHFLRHLCLPDIIA